MEGRRIGRRGNDKEVKGTGESVAAFSDYKRCVMDRVELPRSGFTIFSMRPVLYFDATASGANEPSKIGFLLLLWSSVLDILL